MLKHCIFCGRPFGANSVVEDYAGADRIAFDPARGRLWSVCTACGRWSLPGEVTITEIGHDYVLGVAEDTTGAQHVVMFALHRR